MLNPKLLKIFIESNGLSFKQNSVSYIFNCPRCNKKDKLYIRKEDGRFICWVCSQISNFKGKGEYALKELCSGISLEQIVSKIYDNPISQQMPYKINLNLSTEEDDFGETIEEKLELPITIYPPSFVDWGSINFKDGLQYLIKRGLTLEHVKKYQLKYAPCQQRVIFPIIVDGNLIGWQGRYIKDTVIVDELSGEKKEIPKILTSISLRNCGGRYLMFQDNLKNSEHCVLAEGPISAIKADLCGGNVASMGKAVTKYQLDVIKKHTNKLYLALDTDAASDISRIVDAYSNDFKIYLLVPPNGYNDLGEATPEEVFEQFKQSKEVFKNTLFISLGTTLAY